MKPSDGYVRLKTSLDDTHSDQDVEPHVPDKQPRVSHSRSHRIAWFALMLLCAVESALILVWTVKDQKTSTCFSPTTTMYFQDEKEFRDARTEADVQRAWSSYELRK